MDDRFRMTRSNRARAAWGGSGGPASRPPTTTAPPSIHACFRQWVEQTPQAIAVRQRNSVYSYADLDEYSDHIAAHLHSTGIGLGDIVPVLLHRSPDLIATLLGILKTGAAYTALDPAWPEQRVHDLVAMIEPTLILGPPSEQLPIPSWDPRAVRERSRPAMAASAPFYPSAASDPCCVFFTSGTTTGTPRGALVPHAGTVLLFRDCAFATLGPGSAILQAAAIAWDGLSLEVWSMLTTGGSVLLAGEFHTPTGELVRDAIAAGTSLMWLTSTLFNLLVDEEIKCFVGLDHLLIGGERLSPEHVTQFLAAHPGCRLTNGYGPAEATVFVSTHEITREDVHHPRGIPIGRAVPHTTLTVISDGQPTPAGEVGELHVSGPRLALGYLGPDRPGAFLTIDREGASVRTYATGDLVVEEDDLLYFVGRADRELKIRGHRVEPREVERAVMSLAGVTGARAVPVRGADHRPVDLAIFYTGAATNPGAHRDSLSATLPTYLVPRAVVHVPAFPLTVNGKIDEASLLRSLGTLSNIEPRADPPTDLSPTQSTVLAIVRDLLETEVGLDTRLHDAGATSLDRARLAMQLERTCMTRISVAALSEAIDLRAIADYVDSIHPNAAIPAPPHDPHAPVELNPVQATFLASYLRHPSDTSATCLMVWDLDGPVDLQALGRSLQDLQQRHQLLGARYDVTDTCVAIPTREPRKVLLTAEQDLPLPDLATARHAVLGALTAQPLSIDRGEVWRATTRAVAGHEMGVLGIAVHHVAFDGWSEAVLASDLSHAYAARARGEEPTWSRTSASAAALAHASEARRRYAYSPEDLDYWTGIARSCNELTLVTGPPNSCGGVDHGGSHTVHYPLDASTLHTWATVARDHSVSLLAVLLSLYEQVLAPHVRLRFAVGVPVTERDSVVEENAVGCILNMWCLPVAPHAAGDIIVRARTFQGHLERAQQHRALSFPELVRQLQPPRSTRTPVYQAIFALQDNAQPSLQIDGCATSFTRPQPPDSPVELLVEIHAAPGVTPSLTVSHQCAAVSTETAERIALDLIAALERPTQS